MDMKGVAYSQRNVATLVLLKKERDAFTIANSFIQATLQGFMFFFLQQRVKSHFVMKEINILTYNFLCVYIVGVRWEVRTNQILFDE